MWKLAASSSSQEIQSLQLENHQLRSQLELLYEWLSSEKYFKEQKETFGEGVPKEKRSKEIKDLLQQEAKALFGRIIYRDPSAWSSSVWINIGEENNISYGQTIVAKNSPVVSGACLVGVVEYVGKQESRVRLITDSGLKTAVRAVRGSIQERETVALIHQLKERLQKHPEWKNDSALENLRKLEAKIPIGWKDTYLAKGEVHGSSSPYFRTLKSHLKGIGFNCEFPDEEGPMRDLRTGAIIQEGDLLLTSGLDGVFPPGLKVAVVNRIEPLREGAFSYELEATPAAGNLSDISSVFVLPPVSQE
ncbi:MAG TPA: rod shape-determining protein MreC [Chlamydiales bacterium]